MLYPTSFITYTVSYLVGPEFLNYVFRINLAIHSWYGYAFCNIWCIRTSLSRALNLLLTTVKWHFMEVSYNYRPSFKLSILNIKFAWRNWILCNYLLKYYRYFWSYINSFSSKRSLNVKTQHLNQGETTFLHSFKDNERGLKRKLLK